MTLIESLKDLMESNPSQAVFESLVTVATLQVLNESAGANGNYVAGLVGSGFFEVTA